MGLEDTFNVYYSHSSSSGSIGRGVGDLPKSAIIVLDKLVTDGPMNPKDLAEKVDLAPRTITFALRELLGQKIVKKVPNFVDMRQSDYHVNEISYAKQLLVMYGWNPK